MTISNKHLDDVCMLRSGDHRTCRYLESDDFLPGKWYCHKLRTIEKTKIDQSVYNFIKQCKTKGVDPYKEGVPLGDNCQGYPVMKHIQQGYDVDP